MPSTQAMLSETSFTASAAGARRILRGDLLDFTTDPGFAAPDASPGVRHRPDHLVLIESGRIAAVQPVGAPLQGAWAQTPIEDQRGHLILPGFIDTHVHCPQLDVIASFGTELLHWLNTYTFPAERKYVDPLVAHAGAERFLKALRQHEARDEDHRERPKPDIIDDDDVRLEQ